MPTPPPISRQFFLCFAFARSNRGNQPKGAETLLPSANVTTIASGVNRTSTASAMGLAVEMLVPGSDELIAIILNHAEYSCQFVITESTRLRDLNWFQPEFRIFFRVFNVDMPRLVIFPTEKEEPESPQTQRFRHWPKLASGRTSCKLDEQ